MGEPIYKAESYKIIGCCMEMHCALSKGDDEVIYKDALEVDFKLQGINFSREMEYKLAYKGVVLPHKYFADFVVLDKIILEAKAIDILADPHVKQTLNCLAAAKLKLGLLVNFGADSLTYKRVIL